MAGDLVSSLFSVVFGVAGAATVSASTAFFVALFLAAGFLACGFLLGAAGLSEAMASSFFSAASDFVVFLAGLAVAVFLGAAFLGRGVFFAAGFTGLSVCSISSVGFFLFSSVMMCVFPSTRRASVLGWSCGCRRVKDLLWKIFHRPEPEFKVLHPLVKASRCRIVFLPLVLCLNHFF